jgi:hypothetical protein
MDMQGRTALDGRHFLDHGIPAFSLLSTDLHRDSLTEHLQDPSFTRTNDALAVDVGSLHQEKTHGDSQKERNEAHRGNRSPPFPTFDNTMHI